MNTTTSPEFAHAGFASFARALSPEIRPLTPHSFALVFDDLSVQVVLHPQQHHIVIEVFACDLSPLSGDQRASAIATLLTLNAAGLRGRPFTCGLDRRDFVTLHAAVPLAGLEASAFGDTLDYLLRQARQIRALLRDMTGQHGGVSVFAPADPSSGASA